MSSPAFSFAEFAVELRLSAAREAHGAEALEQWHAREELVVLKSALDQARRNAAAS
jgi:hypothetical protein